MKINKYLEIISEIMKNRMNAIWVMLAGEQEDPAFAENCKHGVWNQAE